MVQACMEVEMAAADNQINPYAAYLQPKPPNAGESRATAMQMESLYELPSGLYQAVVENKTGWRHEQPLLPKHRQSEEYDNREMAMQQAAERLVEKYREFDGIAPLAIDAYYRGDKATRASINGEGFPQAAVDNVYKTMARLPKFGGDALSAEDAQVLSGIMGQPGGDYSALASSPSPKPLQRVALQQRQDGTYFTGDTFLDAVLMIESGGNTNAVSSTGATGLFQFTRGTGRQYGLIGKNGQDLRKNPQANLNAMQRLTADNARYLADKGIEITPATLYLAHQQGAGGAVEIIHAARSGGNVSKSVRENMDLNNGRGKTPAQFYAMFAKKIENNMAKISGNQAPRSSFSQEISRHQPRLQAKPSMRAEGGQEERIAEQMQEADQVLRRHREIENKALVETVFAGSENSKMPSNLREAIYGLLDEIV